MTNKEEKIYKFINERRGYVKKHPYTIQSVLYRQTNKIYKEEEIRKALNQLKNDIKTETYKEPAKIEQKYKTKNIQVIPSIKNLDKNNVIAIADTHFPFCKPNYLEFCIEVQREYKCGTVIHIGDEIDNCAISQWEKDPDGFSAGSEADLAQKDMEAWYKAFPEVRVCIGNHTARPFRMARAMGIPKKFVKTYEEAWNAPKGWRWADHWEYNGTLYTHGTGFSGANAALRIATRHRQNTVIGHIHSEAGVQFNASKIDLIWGMQLGGALDDKTYAAYYAKDQLKKSIVGCGVILGNTPIYIPMAL